MHTLLDSDIPSRPNKWLEFSVKRFIGSMDYQGALLVIDIKFFHSRFGRNSSDFKDVKFNKAPLIILNPMGTRSESTGVSKRTSVVFADLKQRIGKVVAVGGILVQYHMKRTDRYDTFEAIYGRSSPTLLHYVPGTTRIQQVEEDLIDCDRTLIVLRDNLAKPRSK